MNGGFSAESMIMSLMSRFRSRKMVVDKWSEQPPTDRGFISSFLREDTPYRRCKDESKQIKNLQIAEDHRVTRLVYWDLEEESWPKTLVLFTSRTSLVTRNRDNHGNVEKICAISGARMGGSSTCAAGVDGVGQSVSLDSVRAFHSLGDKGHCALPFRSKRIRVRRQNRGGAACG